MLKQLKSKKRGFTIIEIMVVIAIIGILTAIVLASVSAIKKTARDNQRRTDIKLLQVKLAAYRDQNGVYPASLANLGLAQTPKDPLSGVDYQYVQLKFSSPVSACGVSYYLDATLENNSSDSQVSLTGRNLASCDSSIPTPNYGQNIYSVISPEALQ